MRIESPQDWWNSYDTIHQDIYTIFRYVGMGDRITDLQEYRALGAHALLHGLLHDAWVAAPDHPLIHTWPSWDGFCSLCSEYWVFLEAESTNNE